MTMNAEDSSPRAVPVAVGPLLIVLVLFVIAIGLRITAADREVPILGRALAAGHRITRADLASATASVSSFGFGKLADKRSELVGHVTRSALQAGEPIALGSVTKAAVPTTFGGCTLVRFRTSNAATLEVATGEPVRLMFAPSAAGAVPRAAVVHAFLVNATPQAKDSVYFVAVPRAELTGLLTNVGRSQLLVGLGVSGRKARALCSRPSRKRPSRTLRHR
jgi:SAF domain